MAGTATLLEGVENRELPANPREWGKVQKTISIDFIHGDSVRLRVKIFPLSGLKFQFSAPLCAPAALREVLASAGEKKEVSSNRQAVGEVILSE